MSNARQTIRNQGRDQVRSRARAASSAFTLIELLVVIAITVVLLTLLFRPLLFGFQFTSEAQAITEAQDTARVTMEQVTREIGTAAAVRDTTTKYLDLRLYTPTGNDEVITHAYNAYIDIIPARTGVHAGGNTVADPTVNPYADTTNGDGFYLSPGNGVQGTSGNSSPTLVSSPVLLPISPGTTFVRYFIGLKTPFNLDYDGTANTTAVEQPYINRDESQVPSATTSIEGGNDWATTYAIQHGIDNPYVLYRAEVSPYKIKNGTNTVNTALFASTTANGVAVPTLDDPDFFRIETGTDPATIAHNQRVYHWYQAAKPVIESGDANLIFQAHDNFGNVQYSNCATNVGTVSLPTGTVTEATTNFPILRTSVNFAPATVSDQPMNPTSTSDVAQGFGSSPSDALVPYIPTQYASLTGLWSGNKNLSITENQQTTLGGSIATYSTYIYNPTDPSAAPVAGKNPGDLIEASGGGDLYNVTQGLLMGNAGDAIIFSISPSGGTVNFSTPDLPDTEVAAAAGSTPTLTAVASTSGTDAVCGDADPTNQANPFWFVTFNSTYTATSYGLPGGDDILQIHLKPQPQLLNYDNTSATYDQVLLPNPAISTTTNSLPNIATASFGSGAKWIKPPEGTPPGYTSSNGRVVINSERVYGPEENAGAAATVAGSTYTGGPPANYPMVLYHRIPFIAGQVGTIGPDQYMADYDHGIIYLGRPKSAGGPIDISDSTNNPQNSTVLVAFNYQNNAFVPLRYVPVTAAQSSTGVAGQIWEVDPTLLKTPPVAADTVRATYQTNSRIEVAIGVRLYDAQTGHPTYFSLANTVAVGNGNR